MIVIGYGILSEGKCKDDRSDCLLLARKGYCGTHENVMRAKCARTCQYCGRWLKIVKTLLFLRCNASLTQFSNATSNSIAFLYVWSFQVNCSHTLLNLEMDFLCLN